MATEWRQSEKLLTIVIAAYWLALFIGTHLPRVPQALQMPGADKWQHTVAYAGLAFLLAARVSRKNLLAWKGAAAIAGVVVVYGAIDELTQIPVGRDAGLNDWLADAIGTLLGLGSYAAIQLVFRRRK